ncbi:ZP3 protein, partial [Polypterus senegalus]
MAELIELMETQRAASHSGEQNRPHVKLSRIVSKNKAQLICLAIAKVINEAIFLIDATFSKPSEAKEYHLGQEIHFQAVSYPNSTRQWLFLHSCYATPSPNPNSRPQYTVIDNYGCMVDSKQESCSSRFERPRMSNVVSFAVSAFQFNDHKKVYFHCKMFTKKSQDVTNTAKFCTYNKKLAR